MDLEFPALFRSADHAAKREQQTYLQLIGLEYGLLIVSAVLAMNLSDSSLYFVLYAMVFVGSICLLLFRMLRRPEQDWYRCRALAESVRTSTWRYAMRAAPFDGDDIRCARAEFHKYLSDVLSSNRHIGHRIAHVESIGEQTTRAMDRLRTAPLAERRDFYLKNRIAEQRSWYSGKAKKNAAAARAWTIACVTTYGVAIALVLAQVSYPHWKYWPTGVLVVIASAIIGWMQLKKFNELSSAYSLTAHEIGLTQDTFHMATSEAELSQQVNEAELVFSREHTQWVARTT